MHDDAAPQDGWEGTAEPGGRRWPLAVLLAVVLLIAGAAFARGLATPGPVPTPEPDGLVVSEAPAPAPRLMAAAEEELAGTATPLPSAPLVPRRLAATATVDGMLVVWGGLRDDAPTDLVRTAPEVAPLYGDGASYDVAAGTWSVLSDAPLGPRAGALAIGLEGRGQVLVWGGAGAQGVVLDGAIWSADEDAWLPVDPAPVTTEIDAHLVWTGTEVVLFDGSGPFPAGGSRPQERAPAAAVLDPETGRWRAAEPLPPQLNTVTGAAWDGDDVAVWDGRLLALYRPSEDAWRTLVPGPVEVGGRGGVIVRAQQLMIAADALPRAGGRRAWGLVWEGASWGAVRAGPVAPSVRYEVRWSGAAVLAVPRAAAGRQPPPPAVYFPFGNRWAALPAAATSARPGQTVAWLDGALVSWGGELGEGAAVDGVVWRPGPEAAAALAPP